MKALFDFNHLPYVSDEMKNRVSHLNLYYPFIQPFTSKTICVPRNKNTNGVFAEILKSKMKYPIFVKSESKSAKESGFENCIIKTPSIKKLSLAIKQLNNQIKVFDFICIREFLPLEEVASSSGHISYREYRCFIVNHTVVWIQSGVESIPNLSLDINGLNFARKVIGAIKKDFPAFYIMDIAKVKNAGYTVIEVKPGGITKLRKPNLLKE